MTEQSLMRAARVLTYIAAMMWLTGGVYAVVMHGGQTGWWFIIGGLLVLAARLLLDVDGDA